MAKARSIYACGKCAAQQPRWLGRCPECGAWDSLAEEVVATEGAPEAQGRDLLDPSLGLASPKGTPARRLSEIEATEIARIETGVPELDRVLGGGLVPGSVVLVGGEPGIGKSTLALQIAAGAKSGNGKPCSVLYVTGEESPEQLRMRADRLPELPANMWVVAETRTSKLAATWRDAKPDIVLIDSIQTMASDRVESTPGSVAQVRESAAQLSATAKKRGTALILVGHVTKEGTLAGPRVLEHLVDVVLYFEGDRDHSFRLLRASKNRFGATQEVGVFSMTSAGLVGVPNPSELFLAERRSGSPGSCIVPILEGTRPMLVEMQALVAPAGYGTARRTSIGIDDGRLALLLAVLDRRSSADMLAQDVYVNVAGGVKVSEPGADLALALALASSRLDIPLPSDVAAFGEVGLGGEVRRVGRSDLRLREAARMGFERVLLPQGAEPDSPRPGVQWIPIPDVARAVEWLRACSPVHGAVNNS